MAQPAYDYESADFEVPPPLQPAVEEAEHGKVIYLHTHKQQKAKTVLMPVELAEAALEALEDAEALRIIEERQHEERIPWEQVEAELAKLEAEGR